MPKGAPLTLWIIGMAVNPGELKSRSLARIERRHGHSQGGSPARSAYGSPFIPDLCLPKREELSLISAPALRVDGERTVDG